MSAGKKRLLFVYGNSRCRWSGLSRMGNTVRRWIYLSQNWSEATGGVKGVQLLWTPGSKMYQWFLFLTLILSMILLVVTIITLVVYEYIELHYIWHNSTFYTLGIYWSVFILEQWRNRDKCWTVCSLYDRWHRTQSRFQGLHIKTPSYECTCQQLPAAAAGRAASLLLHSYRMVLVNPCRWLPT